MTSYAPMILILAGAMMSAGGAIWLSVRETRQAQRIAASVTGGDSFCYFSVIGDDLQLTLTLKGEFPLYDVTADFVDLDVFEKLKSEGRLNLNTMSEMRRQVKFGNLIPGHTQILEARLTPGVGGSSYNIFFSARNGVWRQQLSIRRKDERWVVARRVHRDQEVLVDRVDEGYPRGSDGEPVWHR